MKGKGAAVLWLAVTTQLLLAHRAPKVAAMAEYMEAPDYETYDVGSVSAGDMTKEDIYDAALLQHEINESERQQRQQQEEQDAALQPSGIEVTELPLKQQQHHMHVQVEHAPLLTVKQPEQQQQQASIVKHLMETSAELAALSNEDYVGDSGAEKLKMLGMRLPTAPIEEQQQRQSEPQHTATVHEYVRKGKADQLPLETKDTNTSSSDYLDDEEIDSDKDKQEPASGAAAEPVVPFAMKFYHNKQTQQQQQPQQQRNNNRGGADETPAIAKKRLDEHAAPLPLPQQQLLSESKEKAQPHHRQSQKQRQQFGTALAAGADEDTADEDYYEDSHESAPQSYTPRQQPGKLSPPAILAVTTPPSVYQSDAHNDNTNDYDEYNNNVPLARAGISSFPLPFSNAWRSTARPPTPQPAVATISTERPTTAYTTTTTPSTTTTASTPQRSTASLLADAAARESNDFTTTAPYNNHNTPVTSVALAPFTSPPPKTTTTPSSTAEPTSVAGNAATTEAMLPLAAIGATTATTTTTTTLRPAGKQGKQINITRRKLLAHEQLRNYIEDAYIRMPLAVIVDPSAAALEKTKALWRDALRTNFNIKIVLVSLNATGIPAAYNFNNTRQFLAGLNSIKEHDGGDAFIGLLHASELVPYDSAVFISTALVPPHTELVQDAAITLLKKRIRLYVIWYGERAASENETQEAVGGILGEVAIRSGGEILHIVGSENSQELEGSSTLTLVADAFRGSQEVDIPVDMTLSNLHVKIDAPMRIATLETPNGVINLKKLVKFKSRIVSWDADDQYQRLDAYVPLNKLRKAAVYQLRLVPESLENEYSVFVRADRKADVFLDDMIKRFDSYFLEGYENYSSKLSQSLLHSITAHSLPSNSGRSTHENLRFPNGVETIEDYDGVTDAQGIKASGTVAPKNDVETFSDTEIRIDVPATASSTTRMPASKNMSALATQRSTGMFLNGVTKIEMGTQSQLLVPPGQMAQLYFELTNTRAEPVQHNIQVTDERRFLLRLAPQSLYLRPDETGRVQVTVLVPAGTALGTTDTITFTCYGPSATNTLTLKLKVLNTADAQDTTAPSVSWTFGNRCQGIASESSKCADRFWTMDIQVQDWDSGVLRLQTTPAVGLINLNTYTVGTTEPLKATYVASCCDPKMALVAYDLAGNQRSYSIDVRNIYLTDAAIVAISLGVLLLVLLIALGVWGCVWCCRRRKVSLDLPTYRSHSTRSME